MVTHLLLIAAGLVAAADKDNDAAKDLQKLQGSWVLASGEKDGKKLADEDVKRSKITWRGKEALVATPHQSKERIRATVTLDPGKTPRQMDWVRVEGPYAGKSMHAIYEFVSEDEYRICFAPAGKDRPTEFRTRPGTGHMLHVWKRVKD